jgi:hypothetical protein
MAHVHLIASPDDYLLEEKLREILARVCGELGGVEPENLPEEATPEEVAVELCSPSLFASQRVIVAPDVRAWLDIPASRGPGARHKASKATADAGPVAAVLRDGLSEEIALTMAAVCHEKPKGDLVKAIEEVGFLHWISLPPEPKPWEDVVLSREQGEVLRGVLSRAAGNVQFAPGAEQLLFDRLGFAPRALAQEGRKLAAACAGGVVDEELVQSLSFPRERSLDTVEDAVLKRELAPILDLIAAAEAGIRVRDRRGRTLDSKSVAGALVGQTSALLQQMLYLRWAAEAEGLEKEMAPEQTGRRGWYAGRFLKGIAPGLGDRLELDAPSPLVPGPGRAPRPWRLGQLFAGAGHYREDVLVAALAGLGSVETSLRGSMTAEALSVWFTGLLGGCEPDGRRID